MKKERKHWGRLTKRLLASVMSAAMAFSFLPASVAMATTTLPDTAGLELSKSISLQNDGTYKISLSAYATGTTTVTTETEAEPLDIVLVLDQSGSMADSFGTTTTYSKVLSASDTISAAYSHSSYRTKCYVKVGSSYYKATISRTSSSGQYVYSLVYNGTTALDNVTGDTPLGVDLYWPTTSNVNKTEALKSAANSFISAVEANAAANNVNHRIAVAGFASGANNELLTGTAISGGNGAQYGTTAYNTAKANALLDVTTSAGQAGLTAAVDNLDATGSTGTDTGITMANDVLNARTTTTYTDNGGTVHQRKKVVVVFTDGVPTTHSAFSETVANNALGVSDGLKSANTSVYSIGIFSGAQTSTLPAYTTSNEANQANRFMQFLSSNYTGATTMDDSSYSGNPAAGYYLSATDSDSLNNVFTSISTSITNNSTTVTLNATSVLKDTISQYFDIAGVSSITAYKVPGTADSGGNITWNTAGKTALASSNITLSGKTVRVTGFDYSSEYVSSGHAGNKLVVEVIVTAKELAAGAGAVPSNVGPANDSTGSNPNGTNGDGAGVYAVTTSGGTTTETAAEYFNVPTVTVPSYAYVLDFGKKVSIPNSELNMSTTSKTSTTLNPTNQSDNIVGTYGKFARTAAGIDYTPTTFKWNGIDKVYGFGTSTGSTNQWYQAKFIPATSVYYEDDFNAGASTTDGSVNIIYSGSWTTSTDGTTGNSAGSNQSYQPSSSATADNYGWDVAYANDSKYSGGSAHTINGQASSDANGGAIATAQFTFTGTGVDIYSRTDIASGAVTCYVYKGDDTDASAVAVVDNQYKSGTLYQVPTLALDMKDYATYKVVLKVNPNTTDGRSNYYLDGIKVYNPMGYSGGDAASAYTKDGELNPYTMELRDLLLNAKDAKGALAGSQTNGSVFIDEYNASKPLSSYLTDYANLGPKNEVYLAKGSEVAFRVNRTLLTELGTSTSKIMIGMKSSNGNTATVKYTNGSGASSRTIKSATDEYYTVTPNSDGYIVIKNVSDSDTILALTKIKVTSVASIGTDESFVIADSGLASYIASFEAMTPTTVSSLSVAPKTGTVKISDNKTTAAGTATATSVYKALIKGVAGYLND